MAFSAFQRHIFKSFVYSLGVHEISNTNYVNHISANICDGNFMSVNSANFSSTNIRVGSLTSFKWRDYTNTTTNVNRKGWKGWKGEKGIIADIKGIKADLHHSNKTYVEYVKTCNLIPTYLNVTGTNINSYNKDSSLSSDISHQEFFNTPASAYIFSDSNANAECSILNDLDYSLTAMDDETLRKYFEEQYDFSSDYVEEEYLGYNILRTFMDENAFCLSADDFILNSENGNPSAMDNGAAGLLLSYYDENHQGESQIPIVYYEFPKVFYSSKNYLEVDWHADGILRID